MLISIVGASGVGKTTFARALCKARDFAAAYEQHKERPFQALFKKDKKYALANQLDYLLYRAEQERAIRQSGKIGLMDGGLDLDFYGFTRLFRARGFLDGAEFNLCRRFYKQAREFLPPPDMIIYLHADAEIIKARLASRNRINIASSADAQLLDRFLHQWLKKIHPGRIFHLDVSYESINFEKNVAAVINKLDGKLFIRLANEVEDLECSTCVVYAFQKYEKSIGPMLLNFPAYIYSGSTWVADDGGKIVGVIVAYPTKKGFFVDTLAVSQPYQGTGIGRALLEHVEDIARLRGFDSVYLGIFEVMTENQTFYSHLGYVEHERCIEDGDKRIYYRKQLS